MMIDLRQCFQYRKFMRQLGWMVEDVGGEQVGYIKRLPFFPLLAVMKVQRVDDQINLGKVNRLAKGYGALFIKLEPKLMQDAKAKNQNDNRKFINNLKKFGYRQDKTSLLATKTRVIDLEQSEKKLLAGMKSKTRYNIGLAKRRRVMMRVIGGQELLNSDLIEGFYRVLRENSRRIKILTYPRRWFEKLVASFDSNYFVILANLKNELVGVGLFLVAGETAYYSHNGTTEKGRKNMAANLMVWEGMREAKRRGCKWFDFDGVYDERYKNTRNWQGFSRFKEGFGGREVIYLGSFVKYWPFLFRLKPNFY